MFDMTAPANATACTSNPNDNATNGLWIRLHSDTGRVTLQFEAGANFPEIHPNCNAPASLTNVHLLRGGGSGTAVFAGHHTDAGPLVMKHGGPKDTLEVFSLAQIAAQLRERSHRKSSDSNNNNDDDHQKQVEAARYMQSRIPEFVGLFCSPHHLRDRGQEAWNTIRNPSVITRIVSNSMIKNQDGNESSSDSDTDHIQGSSIGSNQLSSKRDSMKRFTSREFNKGRKICVRPSDQVDLEVNFRSVVFCIPYYDPDKGVILQNGYEVLHQLAQELSEEQRINNWKVTLMQKTIGGPNAVNGAQVLTSGQLWDGLLDKVINEFTTIIQHLQTLTYPNEKAGIQSARAEYEVLKTAQSMEMISKSTDEFCGSSLRKNFLPQNGRFAKLRQFGDRFRDLDFMLEPAERFPATFLGAVLKPDVDLDNIFDDCAASTSALDHFENAWSDVLDSATCFANDAKMNRAAADCIWTCGLTDAGLHNTFLSESRGLELFDLGKPQFMPVPAFLTKFLMSFFHVLGMEEVEEDGDGSPDGTPRYTWARRFQVVGGKLALTQETEYLLPRIYVAFRKTLDHFVANVFENDERVRCLLMKYVVLQLLSDSAFCLLRWEEKGGGRERFGKQAKGTLHKWLWRSLWDLYIASDVYEKLCR